MANNRPCLHCQLLSVIEIYFAAHPMAEPADGCDLSERDAYTLMSLARIVGELVAKLPEVPDRITLFDDVFKRAAEHAHITVTSSRDDKPQSKGLH